LQFHSEERIDSLAVVQNNRWLCTLGVKNLTGCLPNDQLGVLLLLHYLSRGLRWSDVKIDINFAYQLLYLIFLMLA
jgi:hypothetical protein